MTGHLTNMRQQSMAETAYETMEAIGVEQFSLSGRRLLCLIMQMVEPRYRDFAMARSCSIMS